MLFLLHSKVNQLYMYIYPLLLGFLFHLGHHRALSRVSSGIQQVLISYLLYTEQCIYVNPNLPIHPAPSSPSGVHSFSMLSMSVCSTSVCSLCLCLYFCFANKFICTIFLDFTYKQYYTIFVFLFLTCFTLYETLQVQPPLSKWHYVILLAAE